MVQYGQSGAMVGDVHVLDGDGFAVTVIKHLIFRPDQTDTKAIPNMGHAHKARQVFGMHHSQDPRPSSDTESQGPPPRTPLEEKLGGSSATTCAADSREMSPKRDTRGGLASYPVVPPGLEEPQNGQPPLTNAKSGVNDDLSLQDLGVDSIIEISVVSRLQEYIPERLPPAFLMKNNNIPKLRAFFEGSIGSIALWRLTCGRNSISKYIRNRLGKSKQLIEFKVRNLPD